MSLESLTTIISGGLPTGETRDQLAERARLALEGIFGTRYGQRSERSIRSDSLKGLGDSVPFAGLIHRDNPTSGAYGGMSLIWFPISAEDGRPPCSLLTFVCGTRGISPDDTVIGRPGHVRHLKALRRYLVVRVGIDMWVKSDPTSLFQPLPHAITQAYPEFRSVFQRYGDHIYALAPVPEDNNAVANTLVAAFLDFYAWERDWSPLKASSAEINVLKDGLRKALFPKLDICGVYSLLKDRRFIILQGPPGTGKTRLADEMLRIHFAGRGLSVQFHSSVTYETFVAGIFPAVEADTIQFKVKPGWLIRAIQAAEQTSEPYLLHIDEINRADLGRILGEAIYLFEARDISEGRNRYVTLPQPLPDGTLELSIPSNLYVLGTMNSADRSIAILDLAVRRRFAFIEVWPDFDVIERQGNALATEAFKRLQDAFSQYAPSSALTLIPGHAYFLADSELELINRLRYELMPLLNEYLSEGRLGPCETEIQAYLDWLEGEVY